MFRLEQDIVYGPILSRRLGRSLGVNLLPPDRKVCSFDCGYCYYGPTDRVTCSPDRAGFPTVAQVREAVADGLRRYPYVDHLTFSGSGEPTLHPDFPAVVRAVRRMRDALAPDVRLAIFSNATTAHRPAVRAALAAFDRPMLKLDAGDPATLARVNRPAPGVTLTTILAGLRAMSHWTLQAALIAGPAGNAQGPALTAWLARVAELRPEWVQLYSLHPAASIPGLRPVPRADRVRVAEALRARSPLDVEVY